MSRGRKALVSAFVVLCLITQVLQNLAAGYPSAPGDDAPYAKRLAVWAVSDVRWGFETFGFYTGTNTFWRMFSPVHRYDWWWTVTAVYSDGSSRLLPSPSDEHTGATAFFTDFRETKLLLNLWTRPPMQGAYADHVCRQEAARGPSPREIQLDLVWRNIVPPEEATRTGSSADARVNRQTMGRFACSGIAAR